jgi:AcrR family transcriptional regulator
LREITRKRVALTRDQVLRAAVRLADQSGIESLTMRRLGEQVGVEAMSLYNHVASKEDLLAGMAELIFEEIDQPDGGQADWKAAMRQQAISVRRVLTRHRWAINLLEARIAPSPAAMRHYDNALKCLRNAGFSTEMTFHAYGVIYCYIFGFVLNFNPARHEAQARQLVNDAGSEQYPFAREIIVEYMDRPDFHSEREFERGLGLILDGLERALDTPAGRDGCNRE